MLALTINWSYLLSHLNQNGVTIFMSGFLFTLSFYHFLLFFQHKDKTYILYGLYAFLVFIYIYYKADHFFLSKITQNLNPQYKFFTSPLQWIFNTIYLVFIKVFIDLNQYKPKWNKILNIAIYAFGILLIILLIYAVLTNQNRVLNLTYAYFFVPVMFLLSIITIYYIISIKTYLKYYILIGSISYLVLATISYYSSISSYGSTILFYSALFIENIFFALGLGAKQKKNLSDKNNALEAIIKEQEINLKLKENKKTKLNNQVLLKTREILKLTKQHKKEEQEKLQAAFSKHTLDLRMKALQTQMNPQFLFNSLNSLKHYIISNNKEDASVYLSKLSKLIRKILDNSQLKEISLREELTVMKLYMEVENMRIDNHIYLSIIVEKEIDLNLIKLPPLVLQPILENAIWHGLSLIKEDKKIKINVKKKEGILEIIIEDNGIGRIRAAQLNDAKFIEKQSLGIDITKDRLQAYTAYKHEKLKILFVDLYKDETPIGTRVHISIPLR
jgi:sensor histidine kinase YesM